MLESILYFLLGFLSAGLLALMISPAIWNRAVQLTKRRIESSVPLTLNEIQADKDQLRAEFAMSTRRLEVSVEELREKANRQIIEINRKRDELNKLAEESAEKVRAIEVLEATSSDLRNKLKEREAELTTTTDRLRDTQEKLETNVIELSEIRKELIDVKALSDGRQVELVAKETTVQNLENEVTDYERDNKNLLQEMQELKTRLAEQASLLKSAEKNSKAVQQDYDKARKELAEYESRLEQGEQEISRLRQQANEDTGASSETTKQLLDAQAQNVELESKLAKAHLQMEALLNDASNENVARAMKSVQGNGASDSDVRELTKERDRLQASLKAYEEDKSATWEEERKENAILRERINDLAAQVTAMTASLEGDGSPIYNILERKIDEKRKTGGRTRSGDGDNTSLADRIRALQESANKAREGANGG